MKKHLAFVAAVLIGLGWAQAAQAQCSGQFQAGQVCGNPGAVQAPPSASVMSPLLDRNFGAPSPQGSVLNRGSSVWSATQTPVLGIPGSAAGTLGLANTTSGTLTLQAQSGVALGSSVATFPANTGTVGELNLAQTWSALQTFSAGIGISGEIQPSPDGSVTLGDSTHRFSTIFAISTASVPALTAYTSGGNLTQITEHISGRPELLFTYGSNTGWVDLTNSGQIELVTGQASSILFAPNGAVRGTMLSGGNFGLGTETNPQVPVVISQNVTTGHTFISLTTLGLVQVDGTNTVIDLDAFGTGSQPTWVSRAARGTAASPSNLVSGDIIGNISFFPYVGGFGSAGSARMFAAYNDSGTNLGTYLEFDTTPAGSVTRAQAGRWMAGLVVGACSTDPGANALGVCGSGTGEAIIVAQATAGSPTLTLPNTSGTLADGASSPLVLNATTGNLTINTATNTTLGAAEGDNATLTVTGGAFGLNLAHANTWSVTQTFSAINVNGSSPPTNGLYLPSPNLPGIASNGNLAAEFSAPGSAVNFVTISGSATGVNATGITASGTDTNVNLILKGTGTSAFIQMGSGAQGYFRATGIASNVATNGIFVTPNSTGNPPKITVADLSGTGDTNIGLSIYSAGTGTLILGNAGISSPNTILALTSSEVQPGADATVALGDGTHRFTTLTLSGNLTVDSNILLGAGVITWDSTAPTISSGFCSGNSISNANGTAAFLIILGPISCSGSTGTLSMPTASHGWVCSFYNIVEPNTFVVNQTGGSASTVTLTNYSRTTGSTATWVANDEIAAQCTGY